MDNAKCKNLRYYILAINVFTFLCLMLEAHVVTLLTSVDRKLRQYHFSDLDLPQPIPRAHEQNTTTNQNVDTQKTLLMWEPTLVYHFPEGRVYHKCEFNNCRITFNKSEISRSDVVMFYLFRTEIYDMPREHRKNQIWISYETEPPRHTDKLARFNNFINATFTYRNDSDIPRPYGKYVKRSADELKLRVKKKNYAADHSKLVAWMVSHCGAKSGRDEYVRELKKYIPVDVYGRCGSVCGTNQNCSALLADYKFYLSFENMFCDQYITEKVWRTLNYVTRPQVPVVMGGADYTYHLPPHSFIDVRDYSSPKHLATYLKYLDINDTAYNEYFKWRKKYKVLLPRGDCELCRFVNTRKMSTLKKHDLHKWWTAGRCVSPHLYYRGVADILVTLPPQNGPNYAIGKSLPFH